MMSINNKPFYDDQKNRSVQIIFSGLWEQIENVRAGWEPRTRVAIGEAVCLAILDLADAVRSLKD